MTKRKVLNTTQGRIPVGGVTIPPGEVASVEVDGEVEELLAAGALSTDTKQRDDADATSAPGEEG